MIETTEQRQQEESQLKRSATESAICEFLERVKDISGVLAVRTIGGKDLVDQSVVVEVPDLRSVAADRVYMLLRRLFRRYPGARLDVRVSAVHRGANSKS